jgi:deazaflavin-dependent oxidoreductase (nitroreductase family)
VTKEEPSLSDARRTSVTRRAGLWLTRSTPGVYLLRHVFTPVDKLVLRLTGGRRGLGPGVAPQLLLTTNGRKSGKPRSNPVLYLRDGERYVVVASNYGRERHPAWSYNLMADPSATIQIGDKKRDVVARRATEDEFARYWPRLLRIWPGWRKYRTMTDREFRMFVLEPRSG